MKPLAVAIIGPGSMGSSHVRDITKSDRFNLLGVYDIDAAHAAEIAKTHGTTAFASAEALFDAPGLEAVIIATPHYGHTTYSIEAFKRGLSVLTEKPVGVHKNDVQKSIDAHRAAVAAAKAAGKPAPVYSAMFQQRTLGYWRKIKEMIEGGELGELMRTTWIITDWFRTQYYYDNGGWRATWKGEGGGVLLNQCPHNLDMYQWLVGMPQKVVGFAQIGKHHHIEVEDEVTAYFEHANGMVGHFVTTTGESPGTNRLEIAGDKGKVVFEAGEITFTKNEYSSRKQIAESPRGFDRVPSQTIAVDYERPTESGHRLVLENLVDVIRNGAPLVAEAAEGINSVSLSNAIMLSSFTGAPVTIPLDGDAFERKLQDLIKNSTFKKKTADSKPQDLSGSF